LGLSKYPLRLQRLSIHGINSMDVSAEAMKDMKMLSAVIMSFILYKRS
jgi:hypothetical protein